MRLIVRDGNLDGVVDGGGGCMASIHIGLPPQMIADLDDLVEENPEYDSRSDAVQDAVEGLLNE